ncbi:hypothetical protein GH714_005487 [Hevea brasiliensis]|uniref:TF-B3 domain-containing protein n=1 Tax=Hevea brasiliensis TaxID=3981 RepID=A0A6A6KXY8_HEVBR|nr:hypothetical protein GH714_005487 [Hevea brasiliensis]
MSFVTLSKQTINHQLQMATIFSKSLTRTDIENRLAVPKQALKLLPNFGDRHRVCIRAKDHGGYFWSFECSIRRNGHPKPVLACSNWLAFVRYWDLRVGDTIQLHRERDEFTGVEFKIVVQVAD